MTFAPNDAGGGPARLPMQFGLAKILIALHLLAMAANVAEFAYDRAPGVLGTLATLLLAVAWVGVAWLKGRDGSGPFVKVAVVVWVVLLAAAAFFALAPRDSLDPTVGIAGVALSMAPFHGVAGLLPLPLLVKYLATMVAVAALTAGAYVAGRARAAAPAR